MTFKKYSMKIQIILALILALLNFFVAYLNTKIIHIPLFMDMIYIYTASFFGVPCGIITGVLHTFLNTIVYQHNLFHMIFAICCITGTVFTWLLITRHEDFSWIRVLLLVFLSTIVISFEGSLIYYFFLSGDVNYSEDATILFLVYNLVMQDLGLQLRAFLARLPVNLIDKTIAVICGLFIFLGIEKLINRSKN